MQFRQFIRTGCGVESEMDLAKLQRRVEQLISEDGDHCTLCGREFAHGGQTFIAEHKGEVEIVGDCCSGMFKKFWGASIYLKPSAKPNNQTH
jgi:hypothetical protein